MQKNLLFSHRIRIFLMGMNYLYNYLPSKCSFLGLGWFSVGVLFCVFLRCLSEVSFQVGSFSEVFWDFDFSNQKQNRA